MNAILNPILLIRSPFGFMYSKILSKTLSEMELFIPWHFILNYYLLKVSPPSKKYGSISLISSLLQKLVIKIFMCYLIKGIFILLFLGSTNFLAFVLGKFDCFWGEFLSCLLYSSFLVSLAWGDRPCLLVYYWELWAFFIYFLTFSILTFPYVVSS